LNSLLDFNRAVVLDIDTNRLELFSKVKMAMWGSFNVMLELNLREAENLRKKNGEPLQFAGNKSVFPFAELIFRSDPFIYLSPEDFARR